MNAARRSALLAAALVMGACARDRPTSPTAASIGGRVFLAGGQVDRAGRFLATRWVTDADGVPVELVFGDRIVATTATSDGAYRFDAVAVGGYRVRARLGAAILDQTEVITALAGHALTVADTLRLESRGDLYPAPNPSPDTTEIFFDVLADDAFTLAIVDLAGHEVRTLLHGTLPVGSWSVIWDGRDARGQPATGPLHWALFSSPTLGDFRAQLLFR